MKSIKIFITFIFVSLNSLCIQAQKDFNKLDSNGEKDGLWKGFYEESKRPKFEGVFSHGKEVGIFKFFDDTKTGSLIATREFNKVDGSVYTIFYDQSKNKVSEGKLVNRQFEGIWKYYHQASPIVMTIEHYKNGKLEGLRSVYYPNGKIAEETNYKSNIKNGSYKKYSENAIILEESNFKNGEYDGLSVFKEADGNIVSTGKFLNGKKVGIWQFFEKGKWTKEVNMSKPQRATTIKGN